MGRGGMGSKIGAATKAAQAGANCVIANGIYIPNITKVQKKTVFNSFTLNPKH